MARTAVLDDIAHRPVVKTSCSECFVPLTLNRVSGTVTAKVPWNGGHGKNHVAAHTATEDLISDDADLALITWDCPSCGYADSFDLVDGEG